MTEVPMQSRILILEDEEAQRLGFASTIRNIAPNDRKEAGIEDFVIDAVGNRDDAIEFLDRAAAAGQPYDMLLLDLAVPPTPADDRENPRHGMLVLEHALANRAARVVIVITVLAQYAVPMFRLGASDFITKSSSDLEVQTRLLANWTRLIAREASARLDQRLRDLVGYAEVGLAHRFGACFAGVIQTVDRELDDLSAVVANQFGLDPAQDSHDPFLRHILGARRAVSDGRSEWLRMSGGIEPMTQVRRGVRIDRLLQAALAHLQPCLVSQHIAVEVEGGTGVCVLSFHDDVRAVLQEVLLGTACSMRAFGLRNGAIRIRVSRAASRVKVTVVDSAPTIEREDARLINCGLPISAGLYFRREWGLSVVQHVALRGGGKLEIEAAPDETGNVVSYSIPAAPCEP
jgi:CheY-like chemotaxis protein